MYTEDYKENNFPYRSFFIKLIVILIAVTLIVCISTSLYKRNKNDNTESGTDAVFSENLETMKEKALKYYDENNIPKTVGESSKLTLEKMISSKLLTPIKDKEQKLCDNTKSYVKLTKKENEYQLKVNLVCSNEKDYMILHLNNNSYCDDTYLCEIKASNDDTTTSNEENNEDLEENTITTSTSSSSSNSSSSTKSKKTAKKTAKKVRKSKIIQTSKGTMIVTDTTSKYKYEYAKTNNVKFSEWSLWSNWQTVNCNTQEITCTNTNTSCLKELKRYNRKEKIDSKAATTYKNTLKNTSNISNISVCSNYEYIKVNNSIYRVSSASLYKQINNITSSTKKDVGYWKYNENSNYDSIPSDTYNTHYIYTSSENNKFYFDKYTYTGEIVNVGSYTCSNNKISTIPVYTTEQDIISYTLNIYGTVCYKSERTRTLKSSGTTIKKWSKYNDTSLLNDGYYYTGNRKK